MGFPSYQHGEPLSPIINVGLGQRGKRPPSDAALGQERSEAQDQRRRAQGNRNECSFRADF